MEKDRGTETTRREGERGSRKEDRGLDFVSTFIFNSFRFAVVLLSLSRKSEHANMPTTAEFISQF